MLIGVGRGAGLDAAVLFARSGLLGAGGAKLPRLAGQLVLDPSFGYICVGQIMAGELAG